MTVPIDVVLTALAGVVAVVIGLLARSIVKERERNKEPIVTVDEKKLRSTTDAQVWAKEFMAEFGDRKDDIDEGLMIGWFANAIETGHWAEASAERAQIGEAPDA